MYYPVEIMELMASGQDIDVEGVMGLAEGVRMKKEEYAGRPILLCEYAHCMENSLGNFQEYWDIFEGCDQMAGGFIWDFTDQAIHGVNGKWLYGGDFGEGKTNGYFCANGLTERIGAASGYNPGKKRHTRISGSGERRMAK